MSCSSLRPLTPARTQHARLLGDLPLGGRGRAEVAKAARQPDGGDARCVDRGDARVVARLLEQQAAVGRDDPAGGEGQGVARLRRDVRHAVLVAHEAHAAARDPLGAARALAGRAEALALEVAAKVRVADLVEQRRQPVVHLCLRVRAHRHGHRPVLPGGDDVQGDVGVVASGRGPRGDEGEGERGERRGAEQRAGHGRRPYPHAAVHVTTVSSGCEVDAGVTFI